MRGWACSAHPFFVGISLLLLLAGLNAQTYSAASVVNSATGLPVLAPNGFGTIYGKDFALIERALTPTDLQAGVLPLTLPGTGVRVFVEGVAAPVWYASPTQINFLVPPNLLPKRDAAVVVTAFGRTGPAVNVLLAAESPGLFQLDPETPAAVRLDGTIVRRGMPVERGAVAVLFATGLGRTLPDAQYREVPREAASIVRRAEFQIRLDGVPVADKYIRYVGAAPGFAGLYQINLVVPEEAANDPEVRVVLGAAESQPGLRLPVR
ncbi:MAG: hypothetical protein SFV51_05480 [Bryobacteraceae bacterium]|nr:hypothetical protein [Bryobacteraceae bacterium]